VRRANESRRMAAGAAVTVMGIATGVVGLATAVAPAGYADDPTGSNGNIKVIGHGNVNEIPENAPHQGCTFALEWYGFDEGQGLRSEVVFTLVAPTSGGSLHTAGPTSVFVGEDPAGGGTDLDAREVYTLTPTGVSPAAQGYHVNVTVSAPSPKGGVETFTKTFWMSPCDAPTEPTETPTEPTETPTEPTETPTEPTETPTEPTETPTEPTETPTEPTETPTASPTETPTEPTGTTTSAPPPTPAQPNGAVDPTEDADGGEVGGVSENRHEPAGVPTKIDAGVVAPRATTRTSVAPSPRREGQAPLTLGLLVAGGVVAATGITLMIRGASRARA
jgi:outer membrane biosynthesis protein TonB